MTFALIHPLQAERNVATVANSPAKGSEPDRNAADYQKPALTVNTGAYLESVFEHPRVAWPRLCVAISVS
jgi:hypothetical protein